jgi:hypothetical protein
MTNRLDDVIEQIRQLPDPDQDMFAAILQDELADTERWRTTFAATQGQLSSLAARVRSDIQAGRVEDVDPADL